MKTSAKVIADSINELNDDRLITLELTFPRIIQAQLNTYRQSAKNSASSRAKSMKRLRYDALVNYFEPLEFQGDNKGMYSVTPLSPLQQKLAKLIWTSARLTAAFHHRLFEVVGVHKEISNRVIEPYLYSTVVMTASKSSWDWILHQRLAHDAQAQFRELAVEIQSAIVHSVPKLLTLCHYHLPYITEEDMRHNLLTTLKKLSIARCAAVSYKTFDGSLADLNAIRIYDKLKTSGHLTPFEHVATPAVEWYGNCYNFGWKTERNLLESQC
jgi:thymidylate synthase ThyX